jgi:predicted small secreted protein
MLRRIILSLFLLSLATGLAACGDTWRGMRQDTSENLEKASDAVK